MPVPPDAAAYCDALLREHDRDRWLAHLFAPEDRRPALAALYAFNIEIGRVRELVSGPMPGEVRLQWWSDVLEGQGRGEVSAHPVAAGLLAAIRDHQLPVRAFLDMIEARRFDLYDDAMPALSDLEGYCGETAAALFRLASLVLADGDPGHVDAVGHAGVAYGFTGLLRAFPAHAARGQVYIPADMLERHGAEAADILAGRAAAPVLAALAEMRALARSHLAAARTAAPETISGPSGSEIASRLSKANASARSSRSNSNGKYDQPPAAVRLACLPVALVEGWLDRMDAPGYQPFRDPVEVPQWRRQWRLWRAARRGRI